MADCFINSVTSSSLIITSSNISFTSTNSSYFYGVNTMSNSSYNINGANITTDFENNVVLAVTLINSATLSNISLSSVVSN